MWQDWIWTNWTAVGMTVLSTVVVYAAIITYTRIFGLRSFSKLSAFDFAMTIALGSLFAASISGPSPPLLLALVTLGLLFLIQRVIAITRGSSLGKKVVDNDPILLMVGSEMLHENMRRAKITEDDVRAKLREANVLDYGQVKAVVFETTGDVSVLHGGPDKTLNPDLLKDVRTADQHFDLDG